jgi:hypothetical protein
VQFVSGRTRRIILQASLCPGDPSLNRLRPRYYAREAVQRQADSGLWRHFHHSAFRLHYPPEACNLFPARRGFLYNESLRL